MLAFGILLLLLLSLTPYTMGWGHNWKQVVDRVMVSTETATARPEEPAAAQPASTPPFDAAVWYASRGEAPEAHGLLIESLDGTRVYASHNADEAFNPASLIKLSTTLVALRRLGADYRFHTRVLADGAIDGSGNFKGELTVIGDDPTFGDVGANLIANELRARGVKKLTGQLNVSSDFSFNFSESPEKSAEYLAKAMRLGNPKTGVVEEPAADAPLLLTLNSYPLHDVLLYMNARSSNFIAERVGGMVGGSQSVERFLIDEVKLPPTEVSIERVSGREHNRMTPRGLLKVIRALLEEIKRQGLEVTDIMPVASDDAGTLRRRFTGTDLEGAVVGKTGTLTPEVDGGMASIAGLVYTEAGEPLLFAILDQGNRIGDNRQMEDQLLAEVCNTVARPRSIGGPTPRPLLPSADLQLQPEAAATLKPQEEEKSPPREKSAPRKPAR
jgi:D-alanyl-D-alanine carboxypeptidase/D-alanyl-D-alanine-endopeptidase (penicillin-binding protein 4)